MSIDRCGSSDRKSCNCAQKITEASTNKITPDVFELIDDHNVGHHRMEQAQSNAGPWNPAPSSHENASRNFRLDPPPSLLRHNFRLGHHRDFRKDEKARGD
eukprot:3556834-Rhodomonas_salina.2